jgi:cell division protein FtsW
MITAQKQLSRDLRIFLLIVATLVTIGLVFIYSASSVYALEKLGRSSYYVKKQLWGVILGIIGLILARTIPLAFIKKASPYLFLGSFALTALTLISRFTVHIHGSSRWVNLLGIVFQPSELLKISFLVYVAYLLEKKELHLNAKTSFIPIFSLLAVVCLVLLRQPDFGLTVTLAVTTITLLFIANMSLRYLLIVAAGLIPIAFALVLYKPYRLHRILTFLNPWADPQGAGFQIIQSLIAIGSGSFWGLGITHSQQKFFYLPMQHTDFIFSIIAEETGFFGASLLIMLFVLFLYFGLRIAWQLRDLFSLFVTLGFVILTSLQAIINIAVASGLAPTKGIGLPFISYGNTALVCSLCMVGLVMNCVAQAKKIS